jgi:hypothetical protein
MWNKLKKWLFPEEFKYNALDRDGDGLVQEGSPFERKVTVVKKTTKKAAAPKKKAPVKKTTPAKKTAPKKTTKKSTKKK